MEKTAGYWIEKLGLQPHPEGGFYREIYRSGENITHSGLPERFTGARSMATSIYFLLPGDKISALHRIKSDEGWHFYAGTGLDVHVISPEGRLETKNLGPDPEKGQVFQAVVPHGCWFGSEVPEKTGYALVGCTVAPGFDFTDFEMAGREQLSKEIPQHTELIKRLTY
jgi:uncharacterized protein